MLRTRWTEQIVPQGHIKKGAFAFTQLFTEEGDSPLIRVSLSTILGPQ